MYLPQTSQNPAKNLPTNAIQDTSLPHWRLSVVWRRGNSWWLFLLHGQNVSSYKTNKQKMHSNKSMYACMPASIHVYMYTCIQVYIDITKNINKRKEG